MKTVTFDETQWQLVPKEPTEGMIDAADDDAFRGIGEWAISEGAGMRYD